MNAKRTSRRQPPFYGKENSKKAGNSFPGWSNGVKKSMESDSQDDRYEQFVSLFTRHEPGLRAFVRSLVFSWDDANEIMQNTGLVLWRKFDTFDPETDFMRWACVVARFE